MRVLEPRAAPHIPVEVVLSRDPEPATRGHARLADREAQPELSVLADCRNSGAQERRRAKAQLGRVRFGIRFERKEREAFVGVLGPPN